MKLCHALDLFRSRLRSTRRPRSRRRANRTVPAMPQCEALQPRILPAAATFTDGVLTIEFDEQNDRHVTLAAGANSGELLLNGDILATSSTLVESITIQPAPESLDASNTIDISGLNVMLTFEFPLLQSISVDSGTGADLVIGSHFSELLIAGNGDQTLLGGSGNDTLVGGNGHDSLEGARGHDSLVGGAGNDSLTGSLDNDTLDGGAGFDTLNGNTGNDILLGRTHADVLNGGDGDDLLRGHGGQDTLRGGSGNDRLYGNGSRNELFGEDGDDVLIGGPARDRLRGGADDDTVLGFGQRDHILGGPGDDLLNGGDGNDTARGGSGADVVLGRNDADFLTGDSEDDLVDGGNGDDDLFGGSGSDSLFGRNGDDVIFSGDDQDDKDVIDGGPGFDEQKGAFGPLDEHTDIERHNFLDEDGRVFPHQASTATTEATIPSLLPATASTMSLTFDATFIEATSDGETDESSTDSHEVIRLNDFTDHPRFADIDGVIQHEPMRVVVIDTAFDDEHPYFGDDQVVFTGAFFGVDGMGNAFDRDNVNPDAAGHPDQEHGTHVASIIGSRDNNVAGVAPGVELILLSVADATEIVLPDGTIQLDETLDLVDVADALEWVVDNADAWRIASVNLSLGTTAAFTTAPEFDAGIGARLNEAFEDLVEADVIPVAAAGNSFFEMMTTGIFYPAADNNVISVGAIYDSNRYGTEGSAENPPAPGQADFWGDATTDADRIAAFSQRDPGLLDVFAPGGSIDGANRSMDNQNGTDPNRVAFSGTSMAAPHVAGIVPLIQELAIEELGRTLTFQEFQDLLRSTGERIFDGDDEDDNVDNTNAWYRRLDMVALGQAVIAMGANDPSSGVSNAIGAGIYQDDGVADQYTIRRQVDTVTVDVDGTPTDFLSPADLEITLSTTDAQSNPIETVIWHQSIDEMNDTEFDINNVLIDIPVELRLQGSSDDDIIVVDFSDGDATQTLPAG